MVEIANNLTDHELEIHSTDKDNYPYIKMRGLLVWDGASWEKVYGSSATGIRVNLPSGVRLVDAGGDNVTDDATNTVKVSGEVTSSVKALGTVGNGQKTVTSAGTAEALGSSTAIDSITIKALATNTGNIYVGSSSVDDTNGFVLDAGDTVSLDIDNLADVYIDADTNGEGVSFIYLT